VLEELPNRRAETGAGPGLAETALKIAETPDQDRSIQGATQGTADKSCRGLWRHIDGMIHRCDFGDRDATINCI
jgi:hypothetical protein